jgi:ankyrin repeat protein
MALLLLEHGADIRQKNEDGDTALSLARRHEHADVARMLLRAGAAE